MKREAIFEFFRRLAEANPDPQTELAYGNTYQLLVAVVLSAQATDVGVNKATAKLYPVANTPAAILALVGVINLPIIKFSVDWWNTLHQGASVIRAGGPTMDRAFLIPLLIMAVAFSLLFLTLHLAAMRNEVLRRRVRTLQMMQASRQAA